MIINSFILVLLCFCTASGFFKSSYDEDSEKTGYYRMFCFPGISLTSLVPLKDLLPTDILEKIIWSIIDNLFRKILPEPWYKYYKDFYNNYLKPFSITINEMDERLITMQKTQEADVKNRVTDMNYLKVQLTGIKRELTDMKAQLNDTKAQLADMKAQLNDTKAQFADIKAQLNDTKVQLADIKAQLNNTKVQLADIKAQLNDTKAQLNDTKAQLADMKTQLNKMENVVSEIRDNTNLWSLIYQALIMMIYFFIGIITILIICITSILWIW